MVTCETPPRRPGAGNCPVGGSGANCEDVPDIASTERSNSRHRHRMGRETAWETAALGPVRRLRRRDVAIAMLRPTRTTAQRPVIARPRPALREGGGDRVCEVEEEEGVVLPDRLASPFRGSGNWDDSGSFSGPRHPTNRAKRAPCSCSIDRARGSHLQAADCRHVCVLPSRSSRAG